MSDNDWRLCTFINKMKLNFQKLRVIILNHPELVISLLIFLTCLYIYLANGRTDLGSNDNVPHGLLAFNWLQNHTINFDAFRNGYLYEGETHPYFFAQGLNGHLTSRYPVGTALITFPLYACFYIYLRLSELIQSLATGLPFTGIDITSVDFREYREFYGKLAGTISTALAVVLFYLSLRIKFDRGVSLISAFIFAFATSSWVLSSQDLRQHTISNLVLASIILCLLKANHTQGRNRKIALFLAGIFCGLLPGVRITSGIFSAAAFVYVIYTFRKESLFFLLGLPTVLIHFIWNIYYFGFDNLIQGGYVEQFETRPSSYKFSFRQFKHVFAGLLISPSEGLFFFSPVLLFAFPGGYQVFKHRAGNDEKLILCLTFATILLFLQFCFYGSWMGGSGSYGCRFLTDILPVVCFLVAYSVADLTEKLVQNKHRLSKVVFGCFLSSLLFSTGVQAVGAFTVTDWGTSPIPLLTDDSRVWHIKDSQIERHTRNLIAHVIHPIKDHRKYIDGLNGTVETIKLMKETGEIIPIRSPFTVKSQARRVLKATLRNTGQSQWFGYQSGLMKMGETKLSIYFVDSSGIWRHPKEGKWLNISGNIRPGEATEAFGRVTFPKKPGDYRMLFYIVASGFQDSVSPEDLPAYAIDVKVSLKKKGSATPSKDADS